MRCWTKRWWNMPTATLSIKAVQTAKIGQTLDAAYIFLLDGFDK